VLTFIKQLGEVESLYFLPLIRYVLPDLIIPVRAKCLTTTEPSFFFPKCRYVPSKLKSLLDVFSNSIKA
jgi:hypothetical protein